MIKLKNSRSKAGFTLIELMVTIVIFVILTAVVLFSQSGFNNTILLKNLAYDISLSIRQAQYYGINVNQSQSVANPFVPYGVYFNLTPNDPVHASNKNYIFFSDTINSQYQNISDNKYNDAEVITCSANSLECISKYNIGNGNYISGICVSNSSCTVGPTGIGTQVTNDMTILFRRPNPNAIITATDNLGSTRTYNYADIQVSSANGNHKDIIVTGVGQIYVQ